MSTFDSLPVIVIGAVNDETAVNILSELIDNEVTDTYCKEPGTADRVWRIVNKYYTADVRLHALADGQRPELDMDHVEAHIIHITEDELKLGAGVAAAERRTRAAAAAWRASGVRVVLADAAGEPAALAAWAAAARAELAALREGGGGGGGGEEGEPGEPAGWERARAALHAHAWPGLVRRDAPAPPPPPAPPAPPAPRGGATSSSEGSAGEEEKEGEEERAVERAEAFAVALGALGEAREARGEAGEALEARRDRAEALLGAFCRALGLDPDRC